MTVSNGDKPNPDRDAKGRFLLGNPGGPGNPYMKRVASYQEALQEAVTTEEFKKVVKRLVALAIEGDVAASKVVLDRCLGKVQAIIQEEAISFQLPPIESAADLPKATGAIAEALSDGRLTPQNATIFNSIIESQRRAIETYDHERRLAEIEAEIENMEE